MGLLAALEYSRTAYPSCLEACGQWHRESIAGTGFSPLRYRVFSAFAIQVIWQPTSDLEIALAFIEAHAIALPLMAAALYLWFRQWTNRQIAALAGVAIIWMYLPSMFRAWGLSLYSAFEVVFLCLGLLLIHHRRTGLLFAVLIVVATLNRETALLLPLAYVVTNLQRWRERDVLVRGAVFFGLWLVVFIGIRLVRGAAPEMVTIAGAWTANTAGWVGVDAILNHVFFIPIWVAAFAGIRLAPKFLKQTALVGLPYVALLIPFSLWNEVRLLLPLLVLWMPLALITFEHSDAVSHRRVIAAVDE